MFETDKKMLEAFDILKNSGAVSFRTTIYEIIGWTKSRISQLKNQDKENYKQSYHFSAEDIRVFCDYFKINVNYIFGFESNFYRVEVDLQKK